MLTAERLITELALFECRPGWNLSIGVDPWEGPFLRVGRMTSHEHREMAAVPRRSVERSPRDE